VFTRLAADNFMHVVKGRPMNLIDPLVIIAKVWDMITLSLARVARPSFPPWLVHAAEMRSQARLAFPT
jgi:hypothetical protein